MEELESRLNDIQLGKLEYLRHSYNYRLTLDNTFSNWSELKSELYRDQVEKLFEQVELLLSRDEDILRDKKIRDFEHQEPIQPWQKLDSNNTGIFEAYKKEPELRYVDATPELVMQTNMLIKEELQKYKQVFSRFFENKETKKLNLIVTFGFKGMYGMTSFLNKLIDFEYDGGENNKTYRLFQLKGNKDLAVKQRQDIIELFQCKNVSLWRATKQRETVEFGMDLGPVTHLFETMADQGILSGNWNRSFFNAGIFIMAGDKGFINEDSLTVAKSKFKRLIGHDERKLKYTVNPLKNSLLQLIVAEQKGL